MDSTEEARIRAEERFRHVDLERENKGLKEHVARIEFYVELLARGDRHPEVRRAAAELLLTIQEEAL